MAAASLFGAGWLTVMIVGMVDPSPGVSGFFTVVMLLCEVGAAIGAATTAGLASNAQKEMARKCAEFRQYISNAPVSANDFAIRIDS